MQEVEESKDKVMMGAERRSMVMTEEDKKLTAYHESGHAIVALNEKAADPIHKATIIPRGRALGVVWTLPERDKYSHTREYLEANISKAMGGRVAEEIIFGHEKVTSGASSDIQMATKLAKDMVTKFGMSKDLGPLSYGANEDEIFLGRQITRQEHMSEETAKKGTSKVGKELDSLTDVISFGVAPGFIMYFWALNEIGKFGWMFVLIYTVCCALRLARFNLMANRRERNLENKFF